MQALMKETAKVYDFVLLDSPPIQRVTDSLTLSSVVDGVVLITRSSKTTYDMLESGLKKLRDIHTTILGVVVNGIVRNKKDSGYYGYYEYYDKE
jgi:Mrp family chromosome partitioning ATPase